MRPALHSWMPARNPETRAPERPATPISRGNTANAPTLRASPSTMPTVASRRRLRAACEPCGLSAAGAGLPAGAAWRRSVAERSVPATTW
jgi:hypothetical protein